MKLILSARVTLLKETLCLDILTRSSSHSTPSFRRHHMNMPVATQWITSWHHFPHGKDQFTPRVYFCAGTLQGYRLGLNLLIGVCWTKECSNCVKTWSTGGENAQPLQYSCLEKPMNSMRRRKDMTLKDELPRSVGAQYALEISGEIIPERMKRQSQSKNNVQLWMWLVMDVNSDAVKNNHA